MTLSWIVNGIHEAQQSIELQVFLRVQLQVVDLAIQTNVRIKRAFLTVMPDSQHFFEGRAEYLSVVHVQQIAQTLVRDGVIGLYDFRADVVRAFVAAGWVYDGECVIWKNPQSQSIRTRAKGLAFQQLEKDSSWLRPAMADYILLFRAPGVNPRPIECDVSRDEWIQFASPIWLDILESDTLNYEVARENDDERHICPLQLETVRRCMRLWSNPGDVILSPFMGIGTEGHIAMEQGRRFVGIELKESYFNQSEKNIRAAVKQESLFV